MSAMLPAPPRFQTQSSRVYQSLRDDILTGRLKPEARLVRRALSEQYGTNAIAVAEALWKLEGDGLAKSEPMCGFHVSSFTADQMRGELQLRRALETEVARLCAERAPGLPADELMKKAAAIDAAMSAPHGVLRRQGTQLHAEFHLALARCCGSEAIARHLDRSWFRHIIVHSVRDAAQHPVPAEWHQGLLRVILSGDPDRADMAMRSHLALGGDRLIEIAQRSDPLREMKGNPV